MAPRKRKSLTDEEKKNMGVWAPISLIQRFDDYVKSHNCKSRAEALDRLLKSVETDTPTSTASTSGYGSGSTYKTATKRTRANTMDEWTPEDVDRLKEALDAGQPGTNDQWQTVAASIGGAHSWEQCKKYAVSKLRYRRKRTSSQTGQQPRRTLRSRQAKEQALQKAMRENGGATADFFMDNPTQPTNRKFTSLIQVMEISALNTPASGISHMSRFDLDTTPCTTPAVDKENLKTEVGSGARKRVNRRINNMQPQLDKGVTMKTIHSNCTPKATPKRVSKRPRPSHITPLNQTRKDRQADNGDTDEDYFEDDED